ncbi:MAG: DUF6765 family protein [Fibrobacterota bacterium]
MVTDFHFYAVYALCRLAGRSSRDARTIAYASQYTDDADDGRTISFIDGSSFNPVLTAYKSLRFGNFKLDVQKKVYMSFHFLPCAEESGVPDPQNRDFLVTQPACALGVKVLDAALARQNETSGLHGLGIALHSFADTFAHQGFSGFLGPENDTEALYVRQRGFLDRFFNNLWHRIMRFLIPSIGHGELFLVPDTPNAVYRYFDFYHQKEKERIRNMPRFLAASRVIYEKLDGKGWEKHEHLFRRMFEAGGSIEERCLHWEREIRAGRMGFAADETDQALHYNPDEWKQAAMQESADGSNRFRRAGNFDATDFVRFHEAARFQRKIVLAHVKASGVQVKIALLRMIAYRFTAFVSSLFSLKGRKSFTAKAFRRALFRFSIYGALLIGGEVGFYTVCKLGRAVPVDFVNRLFHFQWLVDPRLNLAAVWQTPVKVLYGQASLWMFFVYACIGLFGIEPLYKRIKNQWWFLRGLAYMFIILFFECVTGWVLRGLTGYDIWYYADTWDIFKYTSWAIAPLWFIVGLLSENLVKFVMKYEEKKKEIRKLTPLTPSL